MEAEPRVQRRRRGYRAQAEAEPSDAGRRDTIVIRLPEINPHLRDLILEMLPGRALLRVLSDLPEEVVTHTRNARRERLMAIRSIIDALIEEAERPPRRRRAQEVKID
jgi:hypothetical protein